MPGVSRGIFMIQGPPRRAEKRETASRMKPDGNSMFTENPAPRV
jgi:hypothetical protein